MSELREQISEIIRYAMTPPSWSGGSWTINPDRTADKILALPALTPDWEYAWEADEPKRRVMMPHGPKYQFEGFPYTPEEIAEFPKGRRVRRRKAGKWESAS